MPFEVYKSRVRIVRDEEVVKKWVDDQSWKTEYVCLNLPEPLRLDTMEAVEKHFRETHKENIIKPVESHTLNGAAARALRSPDLARLVRSVWEDQRRFPLQIATVLSQQFAGHGLQFFKVNKTVTHVCVARPHYLDMTRTPVSEGVKRIVDYINAHPKCTRRQLVEALAPSPGAAAPCCRRRRPRRQPAPRRAESAAADAGTDRRHRRPALADPPGPCHRIRQRHPGNGQEAAAEAGTQAGAEAPAAARAARRSCREAAAAAPEPVVEAAPAPAAELAATGESRQPQKRRPPPRMKPAPPGSSDERDSACRDQPNRRPKPRRPRSSRRPELPAEQAAAALAAASLRGH